MKELIEEWLDYKKNNIGIKTYQEYENTLCTDRHKFFICIQFVIMQTILPKRLFQFGTSYH